MRTVKLIEIASDWPPYLVISLLLLAFAKDAERPNAWKNCLLYLFFFIFFYFTFFLSPFLT